MKHGGGFVKAGDERGAAAVEFALVSVVLFPLMFGTIGFGWTFWEINAAQNTARQAAREASLGVGDDFTRTVACLSAANSGSAARPVTLEVAFSTDPAGLVPLGAQDAHGYVHVALTYRSALGDLVPGPLTDAGGRFVVHATDRIEQLGESDRRIDFSDSLTATAC